MPQSVRHRLHRIVDADLVAAQNFAHLEGLPSGEWVDTEDENDNSSVLALEDVPNHLKRKNNASRPIEVEDSEEERDDHCGNIEIDEPGSLKKRPRSSLPLNIEADNLDIPSPSLVLFQLHSPVAGPSGPKEPPPPLTPAELLLHVLEVLPDVCPDFALKLLKAALLEGRVQKLVEKVVDHALEMVGGYPKMGEAKGKEKAIVQAAGLSYLDKDHRKEERMGKGYRIKSLGTLEETFPRIPVPHIRDTFSAVGSLYALAYFSLMAQSKADPKPYQELKRPRAIKGKGKAAQASLRPARSLEPSSFDISPASSQPDKEGADEFLLEKAYLESHILTTRIEAETLEAKRLAHEEALANGGGIECGCCFGEEVWEEMFQCTEGHLFCRECATRHTETKLGDQSTAILCMDTSGCISVFPESELTRLLSVKSLALYHRLKQAKELEQAGLDGLESCPSCPYAAVIENPEEKLFRCMNDECRQVTCRKCRRKEHIPKTCEEMEADRKLDKRHIVEDAMSDALIRKCPKCAKPFVKESGCNKITCHNCHTQSCYICRKAIPEGYSHFDRDPRNHSQPEQTIRCPLFSDDEKLRDNTAIIAARDAAQNDVRASAAADGIFLAEGDLAVAAPEPGPARPQATRYPMIPNEMNPHDVANRLAAVRAMFQQAGGGFVQLPPAAMPPLLPAGGPEGPQMPANPIVHVPPRMHRNARLRNRVIRPAQPARVLFDAGEMARQMARLHDAALGPQDRAQALAQAQRQANEVRERVNDQYHRAMAGFRDRVPAGQNDLDRHDSPPPPYRLGLPQPEPDDVGPMLFAPHDGIDDRHEHEFDRQYEALAPPAGLRY